MATSPPSAPMRLSSEPRYGYICNGSTGARGRDARRLTEVAAGAVCCGWAGADSVGVEALAVVSEGRGCLRTSCTCDCAAVAGPPLDLPPRLRRLPLNCACRDAARLLLLLLGIGIRSC